MKLREGFLRITSAWNRFFHEPSSAKPLHVFRATFGILVLVYLVGLAPGLQTWFGPEGMVPLDIIRHDGRFGLFNFLPNTVVGLWLLFVTIGAAAIAQAIGFYPRVCSGIIFYGLLSIQSQNPWAVYGSDNVYRANAFLLMFARSGPGVSPWGQRMVQIQFTVIYLFAIYWKLLDPFWVSGDALFQAIHRWDLARFPLGPLRDYAPIWKLGTWSTFPLEIGFATLAWWKPARRWAFLVSVGFHTVIEYMLSVPLYEWIFCSMWIVFFDDDDLSWIAKHLKLDRLRLPRVIMRLQHVIPVGSGNQQPSDRGL